MKQKIDKGRFKFIETWIFPGKVDEFIKETLHRLEIREKDVTHCFAGRSLIGGLRIDIDRELKPDIIADVRDLPDKLGAGSQKNILADPPWEIPYHTRRYLSYAMRDLVEMGGFVIINAPWFPWVTGLELVECWQVVQAFNSYRDIVSFWIFRRVEEGTPCYSSYDESVIRATTDQRSSKKRITSDPKKEIKEQKTDHQKEK